MSVHGILIRKGATVFTIEPTETLANAAKSLTNHDIGALVVMNAEGYTVGIIANTRRNALRVVMINHMLRGRQGRW
ncbi:MAG: CBS domain-containing protein [Rhodoplanes sp.]